MRRTTGRALGRRSVGGAAVVALLAVGGSARAAEDPLDTVDGEGAKVTIFDARATAAPYSFCLDIPQVLIGQKICGGFLESSVTSTSDPRGFALAGVAPVPKLSSVPLLIPNRVPVLNVPIPPEITKALQSIDFQNIPTQCQATFPPVTPADADRTCGGPTQGDAALGAIYSGVNGRAQAAGGENPLSTRASAESRISDLRTPGLQSTQRSVYSLADAGLNTDGVPTATADLRTSEFSILGGALSIQGVRSRTVVATDGTTAGTKVSSDFSYGGATLAGIPVSITSQGIEVATQSVPNVLVDTLTKTLNDVLKGLPGLSVRLLPAPKPTVTNGLVSAQSAGISIISDSNLEGSLLAGTPLEGRVEQVIGRSQAQVSAVAVDDGVGGGGTGGGPTGPGGPVGRPDGAPGSDGGASGTSTGGLEALPGLDGSSGGSAGGELPEIAPGATGTTTGDTTVVIGDGAEGIELAALEGPLSARALKNIYPGFLVLVVLAFIATRFRRRTSVLAPRAPSTLADAS